MSSEDSSWQDAFQCRQCGECCKGFGGTFVTEKDIQMIADFINCDTETFVKDYCQLSGGKYVLIQGTGGYCVFWDELCTIHPVKPRMCRAWPFIESVLADKKNWEIMAGTCPGICTDVPDRILEKLIKEELIKIDGA